MIILFLTILISVSFAVMETKQFHFSISIFSTLPKESKWYKWFYPDSWKNKYKNGDPIQGPKFIGSTTFLVFLTDIYHFCKMLIIMSMGLIFILPFYVDMNLMILNIEWYWNFSIYLTVYFTVFELMYSHILK